ncbi:MAG: 1-acyl-sn-glycerol-3-phosphate acyltransferase [Alphaproteobacteria bacterium]|nr:1-acyl-sn-glycerol-3-phosphate acyltransferase [Alphaproteobacteria bacterium]
MEKYILGLDYEVRGAHHLPKQGAYIVAAKHQSQYETFKLHFLFPDPAIVLKKELIAIPLFGWYLKKTDVIAIDRSTPDAAIQSIQDGARRMQEQGRQIVIFPQGTRVAPEQTSQERPYKIGIARIQEATNLPIIPLAMNAGIFWPKRGFFKSRGKVIFEFLEPIAPGMDRSLLMKTLDEQIESKSKALMAEALSSRKMDSGFAAG